jgi:hypothetical protein
MPGAAAQQVRHLGDRVLVTCPGKRPGGGLVRQQFPYRAHRLQIALELLQPLARKELVS